MLSSSSCINNTCRRRCLAVFSISYSIAGFLFGVDRSKICVWVKKFTVMLESCLGYACVLPARRLESMEDFEKRFGTEDVFIDGVERKIQRPKKSK